MHFFPEKQKQKPLTLRPWPPAIQAMAEEQKFLASFFQKRSASFLVLYWNG
jgi:hypothetical protein